MNADLFSYYLIDTSKLRELGYQDLESLIERFPFCQNLHFLIAKKSHAEHHPDFEKWLHKAATYSTDRSYLYQLLHEVDFQKDYVFEVEKFDLDTLKKVEIPEEKKELAELLSVTEEDLIEDVYFLEATTVKIENPTPPAAFLPEEENEVLQEEYDEPLVTFSDLMQQQTGEEAVLEQISIIEKISKTKKVVKPLPKSSFSSWKKNAAPNVENVIGATLVSEAEIAAYGKRIEEKIEEGQKKTEKKQKKNNTVNGFVDKSLMQNEDIATETLARILALQGRKTEAIAMFEKLKLQIPEKSTFFAAEIKNINKS